MKSVPESVATKRPQAQFRAYLLAGALLPFGMLAAIRREAPAPALTPPSPAAAARKAPEYLPAGMAPNRLPAGRATALIRVDRDQFWLRARGEVNRSGLELLGQRSDEPDRGLRYVKLVHGDPARKEIALTFDDGPHPGFTPRILDILKRCGVKATFFLVGQMAERYPELVRAELADGHSIGNHTYHHVSLVRIPDALVPAEIKACGRVLQAITGKAPRLFRPPGGEYDRQVAEAAGALGYRMVLWTDDPGDYASPGARVIQQRLLRRIGNGGIILVHDGIQQTVDVLPGIIQYLKARGYRFVTVDEMLRDRPATARRTAPGVKREA
ncbi:MAG TPA: polysaccharide deacetylase family protein [Armatimonadota bacterium]|nr:polysaccharide deacetylase family protein [Armatimonadota bacterium]